MNKKKRLFKAIQNEKLDRIPTFYRGTDYISKKLSDPIATGVCELSFEKNKKKSKPKEEEMTEEDLG